MAVQSTEASAPAGEESKWPLARLFQWLATAVVVMIAEIAFFAGHLGVSYLLDAAAVVVFFGIRRARQQIG